MAAEIRDAAEADFAAMLRLNVESEHFLSPLSLPQLQSLRAQAWYCRVIRIEGAVRGFLLALREGADYASQLFGGLPIATPLSCGREPADREWRKDRIAPSSDSPRGDSREDRRRGGSLGRKKGAAQQLALRRGISPRTAPPSPARRRIVPTHRKYPGRYCRCRSWRSP